MHRKTEEKKPKVEQSGEQQGQPDLQDTTGEPQDEGGIIFDDLRNMSDEDISKMFDELLEELFPQDDTSSPPSDDVAPAPKPRRSSGGRRSGGASTGSSSGKSAGGSFSGGVMPPAPSSPEDITYDQAIQNIIDILSDLESKDGGSLAAKRDLNEIRDDDPVYLKLKPQFIAAVSKIKDAANNIREAMRAVMLDLAKRGPRALVERARPYVEKSDLP
jgi:hypothetical protein